MGRPCQNNFEKKLMRKEIHKEAATEEVCLKQEAQ